MKIPLDLLIRPAVTVPEAISRIRSTRSDNAAFNSLQLDGRELFELRRQEISAVTIEDPLDALERYIDGNDLLPVNYLLLGYLQSRSVGLIRYQRNGENVAATGFLISENLLLTNHHVLPVADKEQFRAIIKEPTVEFNFEFDLDRNRPESIRFDLRPDLFFYSFKDLDMAVVAISPTDRTNRRQLKDQGYLVLSNEAGTVGRGDFASIIQHPEGKEKQLAVRKNDVIVASQDLSYIDYVSDTARGSSGAPVFNDQWQVIALHSTGVPKMDEQGQNYLDKDNNIIEVVNNTIDENRLVWLSNRGYRVCSILTHLQRAKPFDPYIQPLFSKPYSDSRPFAHLSRPALDLEKSTSHTTIPTPVAPQAVLAPPAPLEIRITISTAGQVSAVPVTSPGAGAVTTAFAGPAIGMESKFEDELDFTDCEGFDEYFLGAFVPMPTPTPKLRRFLAPLLESPSSYTLKYHHFSTLHHAVRRVPIVSAINVHGGKRFAELDEEDSRKDRWFRDNRIDFDVQLTNQFYAKSKFDRGHLARREDAEWGDSISAAKLAADMTCSYANAVPQVPALNRAKFGYKGKWGQLETELLERGAELERGKGARICVFNGPLFDENDPIFKGVQVALMFYKVVVWFNAAGKLQTTCYRLSQRNLVGEIAFEALRFNEIFKTSQVPIQLIQKITGLQFHETIVDNDTSRGPEEDLE